MSLFLLPLNIEIDVTIQDMRIAYPWDQKVAYGLTDQAAEHRNGDFQEFVKLHFELNIFDVSNLDHFKLRLAKDSKLYIGPRN